MARITSNKAEKLHAKMDRARRTIENIEADLRACMSTAKGGDLSDLQRVASSVRESRVLVGVATSQLSMLEASVRQREGVRRRG